MSKGNKAFGTLASVILGMIIVIGVIIFLIVLYKSTTKDTKITVSDNSIVIDGMYGDTYSLNDVTSVELKNSIPAILSKTNGSAIGEARKGYFELEYLGKCKLFTLSDEGPFVFIYINGQFIIINYKERSETEQLYNDLSVRINK
jgi:hypothetical protein